MIYTQEQIDTFLKNFLDGHTLSDIKTNCNGESFEYSNEFATYYYGNGELAIWPVDADEPIDYEISNVRGFEELLRIS